MRALFLVVAFVLASLATAQDQGHVGSMKFTPPSGWTIAPESGPAAAVYNAPDLADGKIVKLTIYPDEVSQYSFESWAGLQWLNRVHQKHALSRSSNLLKQMAGSVQLSVRSGAYKSDGGEAYVLMITLAAEGHFVSAYYESNDFALMQSHQDEVYAVFPTLDIDTKAGTPTKGGTPTIDQNPSSDPKLGTVPNIRSHRSLVVPSELPTGLPMPAGTPDQAAAILAKKVANLSPDSLPALVTAVRACGFTIRTPDHKLVAKFLSSKGNGIYVEDRELLDFFTMTCQGDSISASGLNESVDYLMEKASFHLRLSQLLPGVIAKNLSSAEPGPRFFARFLVALGKASPQAYDWTASQAGKPTRISPIEAFLIVRTFSEDLRRKLLEARKKPSLEEPKFLHGPLALDSVQGQGGGTPLPGYAEDAMVSSLNTVTGAAIGLAESELADHSLAAVNILLSFIKFLETYACLEVAITVTTPKGEPLIRTHSNRENGEQRELNAACSINAAKVHQLMKAFRYQFGVLGFDVDMPVSGKLSNTHVRWRLPAYTEMSNVLTKPAQFVGSNPENTLTDSNGVARINIEGTKQLQPIPAGSPPMKSVIAVQVMVQVKGVEIKQDLVDALSAGASVGTSPTPFLAIPTVLQEMIFRSTILVNGGIALKLVDWTPGNLKAAYSVTVKGNGVYQPKGNPKDKTTWSVNRSYQASGFLLSGDTNAKYVARFAAKMKALQVPGIVYTFVKVANEWAVNDKQLRDATLYGCVGGVVGHLHGEETYTGPLANANGHFGNGGMYYGYDFSGKHAYLDIREVGVDGNHKRDETITGRVQNMHVNEDIAFSIFPNFMDQANSAAGWPLGVWDGPSDDPTEIEAGSAITGTFKFVENYRYHDGTLTVEYQWVVKPVGDDDEALYENPESPLDLFLRTSEVTIDRHLVDFAEPTDFGADSASCFPTNPGPLRSLHSVQGKRAKRQAPAWWFRAAWAHLN